MTTLAWLYIGWPGEVEGEIYVLIGNTFNLKVFQVGKFWGSKVSGEFTIP